MHYTVAHGAVGRIYLSAQYYWDSFVFSVNSVEASSRQHLDVLIALLITPARTCYLSVSNQAYASPALCVFRRVSLAYLITARQKRNPLSFHYDV